MNAQTCLGYWCMLLPWVSKNIPNMLSEHTDCTKKQTHTSSTVPRMKGLENVWRHEVHPIITCSVYYYKGENVSFRWELIQSSGYRINPQSYMKPSVKCWSGVAKYISALNHTLSTDDVKRVLRCIVRVDFKSDRVYEAKVDERISPYSRFIDQYLNLQARYGAQSVEWLYIYISNYLLNNCYSITKLFVISTLEIADSIWDK